ncbi:MAG: hypothetical protein ABII88_08395 [Candidatus Omnitrophota bacterium]
MKLYTKHPDASMSMHASSELSQLLQDVVVEEKIKCVVETGTYQGLGSTTFIAESFPKSSPPEIFVTIETNWQSWREAKKNLLHFPFVKCLWGQSVRQKQALDFISNDEALINHRDYEDIFIDVVTNPVGFYTQECRGAIRKISIKNYPHYFFNKILNYDGEGLLEKWLQLFKNRNPLIVLDSAGGIGMLEFMIMKETMGDQPYIVLLDDIHHVKHFRSVQQIKLDPGFQLLGVNETSGWALAKHAGGARGKQ